MTGRCGWIDATGGISGDMLLGACVDAGVELAVVQAAIDRLGLPEAVRVTAEPAMRAGLGGTRVRVEADPTDVRRTLADVLALLDHADAAVRDPAAAVFRALAEAEARVHRMPVERVHFHEVGALDSIADVVGVVAGFASLRLDRLVCSQIALGGGRADTAHGPIPVPGPAVIELLRGHDAPGVGGPVETELATPTGVALAVTLADRFGPLPGLRPELVGVGAGERDPVGHANITRLVVGAAGETGGAADLTGPDSREDEEAVVLETNVDDLDPRLWPAVLAELLDAGASDAWLSPILMKKGRPAHTLSVLTAPEHIAALERIVFTGTTTIGLRRRRVTKRALPRETITVEVHGHPVRVKLARLDGEVVNAVPEYDDVAAAAAAEGVRVAVMLDRARVVVRER